MALPMNPMDYAALCACGHELGDHGALDPHPCTQRTIHPPPAAGELACGCARFALPTTADEVSSVAAGVLAPTIDQPIAVPVEAKPSALDDATNGIVVVDDGSAAGAMVWWRLSGITDVDAVNAAFAAAGIEAEEHLAGPSPADALRIAMMAQRTRRTIMRPLPGGNGWAVVVEQVDQDDLTWTQGLKVTRDCADPKHGSSDLTFDPADHPAAPQIRTDYEAAFAAQSTGKVGAWLTRMARRSCDGIGLRENGGVYFVPAPKVPAWKERLQAIRSVTKQHTFALVPAMRTEDAIAAVVDALTAEAANEAAALEAEVMSGELSARSLDTRLSKTRDLAEKVGRYARLMGQAMPDVATRLAQLEATIAAATLAARAAEAE